MVCQLTLGFEFEETDKNNRIIPPKPKNGDKQQYHDYIHEFLPGRANPQKHATKKKKTRDWPAH